MTNFPAKLSVAAVSAVLGLVSLTPIVALADTTTSTGDSNVSVSISNNLNNNVANTRGGGGGNLDVSIFGNGSKSHNSVNVEMSNVNSIRQSNSANVVNNVNVVSNTGENSGSSNTEFIHMSKLHMLCLRHHWMSWCL